MSHEIIFVRMLEEELISYFPELNGEFHFHKFNQRSTQRVYGLI